MTDRLPHNLLALFQPRPPLRYLPPNDTSPEERRTRHIDGVAAFMPALIEKQQAENAKNGPWTESHLERADREKVSQRRKSYATQEEHLTDILFSGSARSRKSRRN